MRSRKRLSFGFGAVACATIFATLAMPQAPAPAPFTVHQLKPNVYWVEGGGGNSGVIVGDKGVIIIDAKTTAAGGKELLDDVAKITPKPVTAVILTHSHLTAIGHPRIPVEILWSIFPIRRSCSPEILLR
jgi:alkyl sulfatase BDS1-like metallo-beta-lactamase superfamily hydrolase